MYVDPKYSGSSSRYLWQTMEIVRANDEVYFMTPTCTTSTKDIKDSVEEYYASDKNNEEPDVNSNGWSTSIPSYSAVRPYIWRRTRTTYSDGTTSISTPVVDTRDEDILNAAVS